MRLSNIVNGNLLAKQLQNQLLQKVIHRIQKHRTRPPKLEILLVGHNPASQSYVKKKMQIAQNLHIEYTLHRFNETNPEQVHRTIDRLNNDKSIDGILVQLPLPLGFNKAEILESIDPDKDVDCLHPYNQIQLYRFGEKAPLLPCTPHAIMYVIDRTGVDVAGKRVVVIGKSNLVGLPTSILLMMRNATVTVCNRHSKNHLDQVVKEADVIVAAAGCMNLVKQVKKGAVIIDVGINKCPETKKLKGDVHPRAYENAQMYTPVPGGIGPLTVTMLMHNVITLWEKHILS